MCVRHSIGNQSNRPNGAMSKLLDDEQRKYERIECCVDFVSLLRVFEPKRFRNWTDDDDATAVVVV